MLAEFARVRPGETADAAVLCGLFREAWLHTYRGLIPHHQLTTMVSRRDEQWWRRALAERQGPLLVEAAGQVAGYATFGSARRGGRYEGEIYELYLGPVYQGLGLGERLFESVRQVLDARRLRGLVVWALTENEAACDFYARRGGRPIGEASEMLGGRPVAKTAFGWD